MAWSGIGLFPGLRSGAETVLTAARVASIPALLCASMAHAGTQGGREVSCIASYYHVYIHNDSQEIVEAGSVVEWQVPFTRSSGRHRLLAPLEPGSRVLLANALGSDYFTGEGACDAALVRPPAQE